MYCIFLPGIANNIPVGDLILSVVEVTQSIQDMRNSVPLVAGHRTIARIYAHVGETGKPLANVHVLVTANRNGVALSSSPIALTATLPPANDRADFNTTINYVLPDGWLQGTVDLTVRLDPGNVYVETNEANNEYQLRLTFNRVSPLQIKIVPIEYTHSNGVVYPAPIDDSISDWIYRTYPVSQIDISWHDDYPFTGDLATIDSWYTLLEQISALKSAEQAPKAQVYYALVPVSGDKGTWFRGGVAGIGWIGQRVSVGLDQPGNAAQVAAHEIGHNFGMYHTPCGNPATVDPNYPYANGSIGQYGLDVFSGTVYPPSYLDVMSYCSPKWVSDYTYKTLYRSQSGYASGQQHMQVWPGSATRNSLLVRYRFNPDGVQALPAYVLPYPAPSQPEAGDYLVQVLGASDEVLSETQVKAYSMALDEEERFAIHEVIPLPEGAAVKVRLVKDGRALAEQILQANPSPQISLAVPSGDGASRRIHWSFLDRPVLVRYTADRGQTWTIVGVDVTGGQMKVNLAGLPNPDVRFEVIPAGAWD